MKMLAGIVALGCLLSGCIVTIQGPVEPCCCSGAASPSTQIDEPVQVACDG